MTMNTMTIKTTTTKTSTTKTTTIKTTTTKTTTTKTATIKTATMMTVLLLLHFWPWPEVQIVMSGQFRNFAIFFRLPVSGSWRVQSGPCHSNRRTKHAHQNLPFCKYWFPELRKSLLVKQSWAPACWIQTVSTHGPRSTQLQQESQLLSRRNANKWSKGDIFDIFSSDLSSSEVSHNCTFSFF